MHIKHISEKKILGKKNTSQEKETYVKSFDC